jgi:DNA-binding winged helix-turn-helix (wHTH) protein/TolB-like protein
MRTMAAERFRFGLFEFELGSRELRREGAIVRLQAQPAQVLAVLMGRAGQVVTREELRAAVWDSATFVDFDRGLNFCIAQIRAALGDDATEPRFIRTLPKRGYQFIAPIQKLDAASLTAAAISHSGAASPGRDSRVGIPAVVAVLLLAAGLISKRHPIVAVLRFDNETGKPELGAFAEGLTDTVVEQLTSQGEGHFQVIGNAKILRAPRDERDLNAIAAALNAAYVVLGQVQANASQTRVLAHLIRLPDQTHLWVVRTDRAVGDPLAVESDIAQQVAAQFSPRIVRDSAGAPLPPLQNRSK